MTPDELFVVFDDAAKAARTALEPLTGAARRERTDRPGQYVELVGAPELESVPFIHGLSDFHRGQRLSLSYFWTVPGPRRGVWGYALGGWS